MSRILKRPMFRKGGSTNEGIMTGIVDRKGYQQGTTWEETLEKYPTIKEAYGAIGGIDQPRDTSLYEMLIGGGLNLVSGAGAGEGLMSNVAKSYKGPSEEYFKAQRARQAYESDLKTTAAQAGLQQKWKMDLKGDENSPLFNVYLEQGVEQGMSGSEAQRFATYHTTLKEDLREKVGGNRVGGIIEFYLNDEKQKRKQLPKMKQDIGKYFYDPYDGKIKQLVEQNGVLGFLEFDSVDSIDLTAVPSGVSTESSTPHADALAAQEEEKEQSMLAGDISDQLIMGLTNRFP